MKRRTAAVLFVIVAFAPGTAHAAVSSVDVVATAAQPGALLVRVAVPTSDDLTGAPWAVRLDGRDVRADVSRVPNDQLQVALAMDVSGSMQGAPLDAAKAAAMSFVDTLPRGARAGLVTFGDRAQVVVPVTDDRRTLDGAIRGLRAAGETSLYDGVIAASKLFVATGRHAVVVLSDGRDTVSTASQDDVIGALTSVGATGYVASLVTPDTDASVLNALAERSGGRVVSATDAAGIRSVFDGIARTLTNEYDLRIPADGHGQASLSISVAGVQVDRVVELAAAPAAPRAIDVPHLVPPREDRWLRVAGLSLAGVGLLAFGLIVFGPRTKQRRRSVTKPPRTSSSGLADLTHRASAVAERSLQKRGLTDRVDSTLEAAGLPIRPGELAVAIAGVSAGTGIVCLLLFGPLGAVAGLVLGVLASRSVLRMKAQRRRNKFSSQLGDTLQLLAGSLRAGYGLAQALDSVARNADQPTAGEFGRLVMELRVGRPVPDALTSMADRVDSADFRWVVDAIAINREVGGDLTELLDRAGRTIRERERVRRQIKSLSAEGRLSAVILVVIPILLFLYMRVVNPSYIGELTGSAAGLVVLGFAGGLLGLGGLWLRKLVQVEF